MAKKKNIFSEFQPKKIGWMMQIILFFVPMRMKVVSDVLSVYLFEYKVFRGVIYAYKFDEIGVEAKSQLYYDPRLMRIAHKIHEKFEKEMLEDLVDSINFGPIEPKHYAGAGKLPKKIHVKKITVIDEIRSAPPIRIAKKFKKGGDSR